MRERELVRVALDAIAHDALPAYGRDVDGLAEATLAFMETDGYQRQVDAAAADEFLARPARRRLRVAREVVASVLGIEAEATSR